LIVDGREFNGRSQGNYQGLDLVSDLYVGGHPDFNRIAQSAGYREGFVGRYFFYFMKYVIRYTFLSKSA